MASAQNVQGARRIQKKAIQATEPSPLEISIDEFCRLKLGRGVILLDVREDNEWHNGHLAGAVHLRRALLDAEAASVIPKSSTRVICYCAAGYRSALAVTTLRSLGYTNASSLAGGTQAWTAAGLPITKSDS